MTAPCQRDHLYWEEVPGGLALFPLGIRHGSHEGEWGRDEPALDRIDRLDRPDVYLDLSGWEYISSADFPPLLRIARRALARGGRLILCGVAHQVREIFALVRIDSLPWFVVRGEPMPGRPLPDPEWLSWEGGVVLALARDIASRHEYALMPVLADALSDAGCTSADLLDHLRSPSPHGPKCWAVQLLLGRS